RPAWPASTPPRTSASSTSSGTWPSSPSTTAARNIAAIRQFRAAPGRWKGRDGSPAGDLGLRGLRRELDTLAAIFAEEATRRQADDAAAAGASAANPAADVFDAVSGLLDERFFAVTVQQRVAAARRQL